MESTALIRIEVPSGRKTVTSFPLVGDIAGQPSQQQSETCRHQHCGSNHNKQEAETEKRFSKFNHKARRDLTELGYGNRPHTPHRSHAYR
jgi:hypothetical protein